MGGRAAGRMAWGIRSDSATARRAARASTPSVAWKSGRRRASCNRYQAASLASWRPRASAVSTSSSVETRASGGGGADDVSPIRPSSGERSHPSTRASCRTEATRPGAPDARRETQPVATGSRGRKARTRAPQSFGGTGSSATVRAPGGAGAGPGPRTTRPGWSQLRAWAEAAPSAASRSHTGRRQVWDAPSATREPRRSPLAQAGPHRTQQARTPARAPPPAPPRRVPPGRPGAQTRGAAGPRPGPRGPAPGARRARRWAAGRPGRAPAPARAARPAARPGRPGAGSAQTGPDRRRPPSCPGSGSGFGSGPRPDPGTALRPRPSASAPPRRAARGAGRAAAWRPAARGPSPRPRAGGPGPGR